MLYYTFAWIVIYALLQAGISTFLSVIFALPLAHFFTCYTFRGKSLFLFLASFFCVMPTKICALSIQLFYGLDGLSGIISAHLLLNVPFAFYLLHVAYQKIDWLTMWVSADLGAPPWRQYKDTIFTQIRPALLATSLLIFLLCFSSFSIPRIFAQQYYHYTPDVMLFTAYQEGDAIIGWYLLLRLMIIVPLGFLYQRMLALHQPMEHIPHTKGLISFNSYSSDIYWLGYLFFIFCAFCGPLVMLLIFALQHSVPIFFYDTMHLHVDLLLQSTVAEVIRNSIAIALISSIGSIIIGCLLMSFQLLSSTIFVHLLVQGIALFPYIFGNIIGGMLCVKGATMLTDSPYYTIVVSHLLLHYPLIYRFIAMQWYAYPSQLNQLARSLGASSWQIFCTILLPFVRTTLYAAGSIVFGLSLVEVGAGAVIADNVPLTMPLAMRLYYTHGKFDGMLGLSLILFFLVSTASYFCCKKNR